MADRVGQQLGNYRLIRLLGQGGFADVYLGEHLHLGTQAALKVLHARLTRDDVDTFRTEARTIARLVHAHIMRVFDFGIEGETPFAGKSDRFSLQCATFFCNLLPLFNEYLHKSITRGD